jgi:hypothetical protein
MARLARISNRNDKRRDFQITRKHRDRQHTAYRTQLPVEGQFADQEVFRQIRTRQKALTSKNAYRHRKVEGRTFLLHVGRRQIDGDGLIRKRETVVADGRNDAAARLPDRRVRQSDNIKIAIASGRDVDLHIDRIRLDAEHGSAPSFEEHEIVSRDYGRGKRRFESIRRACGGQGRKSRYSGRVSEATPCQSSSNFSRTYGFS